MEISNRTISMLLIATIAIYLGGTFISLNKLTELGYRPPTGLVTVAGDGNVSVEISSQVSILWAVSQIQWGSGYVHSSCNNCTMFVNTTQSAGNSADSFDSTCCVNFNWSNHSLLLRNDGNQNVNIQMNVTENVTDWFGTSATNQGFYFKIVDEVDRAHDNTDASDSVVSCLGNGTNATGWNFYNSSSDWTTLDDWVGPPRYICGDATGFNFTFGSAANEANFDVRIEIPQSFGTAGVLGSLFRILATSS